MGRNLGSRGNRSGGGNQNVIVDISLPLADAALMDVLGLFATGDLSTTVTMRKGT